MKAFTNELKMLGGGYLPVSPKVEFLYRMVVHCDHPIEVGDAGKGMKRIIPITGGRFEGPLMSGIVLPLGADWNSTNPTNRGEKAVDTRYALKTNDGAIISLYTHGLSKRSEELVRKREEGKPIDPADYYFRQHLFFETGHNRYQWLNSLVAFGIVLSKYTGGPGVIYDAYYLD